MLPAAFDIHFRDDLPAPEALELPLFLPAPFGKAPDRSIWIDRVRVGEEDLFGERIVHQPPREETVVLRRSEAGRGAKWLDSDGNAVTMPDAALDVLFPPRVWMSDSAMERSMMFHAARRARGDVLVGGLGLAIYPQFVLGLGRPVTSITIVDGDADVLKLVGEPWVASLGGDAAQVTLVKGTIEAYLTEAATPRFDTIYLDTWSDLHWRLIAAVNHLIGLAGKHMHDGGQIQAWGWFQMRSSLVAIAKELEEVPERWDALDTETSPALDTYLRWRRAQPTGRLAEVEIVRMAGEIAETVSQAGEATLHVDVPRFGRRRRALL